MEQDKSGSRAELTSTRKSIYWKWKKAENKPVMSKDKSDGGVAA